MNYFYKLFFITFLLTLSIYAFILSVDPYDKFHYNFWNLQRGNKVKQINQTKENYKIFLLGSSRVERFDPEYIERITGKKTFNYGINKSMPEDLLAVTRHVIDKQKPETIFIQLDFSMLNQSINIDKRLKNSYLNKYLEIDTTNRENPFLYFFEKSYFTFDAIKYSVFALRKSRRAINHKENGMYTPKKIPKGDITYSKKYFQYNYYNYRFSKDRIDYLKKIKQICEKNNINLIVSIAPMVYHQIDKIFEDPDLKKHFLEFKEIAVDIFGQVYDFNNFSTKDYKYPYWLDSVHSTEALSNIMTDIIFKGENISDFGILLNKDNISAYIENLNQH